MLPEVIDLTAQLNTPLLLQDKPFANPCAYLGDGRVSQICMDLVWGFLYVLYVFCMNADTDIMQGSSVSYFKPALFPGKCSKGENNHEQQFLFQKEAGSPHAQLDAVHNNAIYVVAGNTSIGERLRRLDGRAACAAGYRSGYC